MAVLREWRAEIKRALKEEYVQYVKATGLDSERTEIVTLSWWTDTEAIKAFAGADYGRARYFPDDDRFLLTRPEHVHHYEATVPGSAQGARVERS